MVIKLQIKGIKRFNHFIVNLPTNMEKEVMKSIKEFSKFVQISAKQRVSRKGSGKLKESIKVKPGRSNVMIIVDSPYARFQEFGYTPHWVHTSMPNRVGGTIGSSLNLGKKRFIFVKRFKPFIGPALEMGLSRMPTLLKMASEKAIIKSVR